MYAQHKYTHASVYTLVKIASKMGVTRSIQPILECEAIVQVS